MVNRKRNQEGSITIQALLYIGIFVLVIFMAFEIWKIISVKQSLKGATYQAARYIALNGLKWTTVGRSDILKDQVELLVKGELHNNRFLPSTSEPRISLVTDVKYPNWCQGSSFQLRVEIAYAVPIPRLGNQPTLEWLILRQDVSDSFRCYSYH